MSIGFSENFEINLNIKNKEELLLEFIIRGLEETLKDVKFPAILFEELGSDNGRIFESGSSHEEILMYAEKFLTPRDTGQGV